MSVAKKSYYSLYCCDFAVTGKWKNKTGSSAEDNDGWPFPRHNHSAVVHDRGMWVFGGMNNLSPLSDVWRYILGKYSWFVMTVVCNNNFALWYLFNEHFEIS